MLHAARRHAPLFLIAALAGALPQLAASAHNGPVGAAIQQAIPASVKAVTRLRADEPKAPEPVRMVTVWEGLDIDGDGAPDFRNPTGHAPRQWDDFGSGRFGASRDGGVRRHEGADYSAVAGQTAVAPISGFVTKVGYPYADAPGLRYVEISNPALGYSARVFYLEPSVTEGQAVRLGDPIGQVASLQDRYPGITDHVHVEIAQRGERVDPEAVIVARLKPAPRG